MAAPAVLPPPYRPQHCPQHPDACPDSGPLVNRLVHQIEIHQKQIRKWNDAAHSMVCLKSWLVVAAIISAFTALFLSPIAFIPMSALLLSINASLTPVRIPYIDKPVFWPDGRLHDLT